MTLSIGVATTNADSAKRTWGKDMMVMQGAAEELQLCGTSCRMRKKYKQSNWLYRVSRREGNKLVMATSILHLAKRWQTATCPTKEHRRWGRRWGFLHNMQKWVETLVARCSSKVGGGKSEQTEGGQMKKQ